MASKMIGYEVLIRATIKTSHPKASPTGVKGSTKAAFVDVLNKTFDDALVELQNKLDGKYGDGKFTATKPKLVVNPVAPAKKAKSKKATKKVVKKTTKKKTAKKAVKKITKKIKPKIKKKLVTKKTVKRAKPKKANKAVKARKVTKKTRKVTRKPRKATKRR